MNHSSDTWALVTDGGKARILSLKRYPGEYRELLEMDSPTRHSPSRDLESDSSGRSHHILGPDSHVHEPRKSAHDQGELHFTHELIERLSREAQAGKFKSLVLVADPRTLGKIRDRMNKSLRQKVILELNLDLTGLGGDKLNQRLRKALGWPTAK